MTVVSNSNQLPKNPWPEPDSEALAHSALARRESRGSHQRMDYPERDDEQYLRHSLAYHAEGDDPRIEYLDVVITRWPPGERVYGSK